MLAALPAGPSDLLPWKPRLKLALLLALAPDHQLCLQLPVKLAGALAWNFELRSAVVHELLCLWPGLLAGQAQHCNLERLCLLQVYLLAGLLSSELPASYEAVEASLQEGMGAGSSQCWPCQPQSHLDRHTQA